ncbi:MAG: hypothetical protein D6725_15700 [Planctomycetota bacterium]|nr:MAG: hypothetical protein D6725_15700 [Planctomycetota bacterium]
MPRGAESSWTSGRIPCELSYRERFRSNVLGVGTERDGSLCRRRTDVVRVIAFDAGPRPG